jgi:phage-related protein
VGKVSVRVVPNTSGFRRELYAQLKRLDDQLKVQVGVEVNDRDAKNRLKALQTDLRRLGSGTATVDVHINDVHTKQRMRTLLSELSAEAKAARVQVNVDVDSQMFKRAALSMDNMAQSAGGLSRGFAGVSRTGAIVGAVFAAAAPAVGLVSGILAGLPALIGAFGSAVGAVALGMEGIKAAAMPLKPLFDDLKTSVSSVFATRLPPIFDQLQAVFPVIKTGMQAVAGGLTDMFQGAVTAISSGLGIAQLNTILQGTAGLFTSLQPAVQRFTETFLAAGAAGAQAFGHLTGVITNFANTFGGAIDRMIANGSFEGAIAGMSTALDGFLTLFSRLFEVGGTAMQQLGTPLATMFGGIGDLLVAAMPALTSFSAGVANTIGALGTGLAPAFAALTPAVDAIMPTITSLATILGGVLAQAVQALAPALTAMAQVLGPVLTAAATALAPIMNQLATTLGTVLLAAVQALAPIMPQLVAVFVQLATTLSGALAQVLPQLVAAFVQLLPVFIQLVPPILQLAQAFIPLIPAMANIASAALQALAALTPVLNVVVRLTGALVGVIAKIVEFAANLVSAASSAASGFVSAMTDMFSQAVQAVVSGIANIVSEVTQLGAKIASAASNFGSVLIGAGKALMDGLLNGIMAGFNAVAGFVSGIAGKIASLKGPIPYDKTVLIANGEALMSGLDKGIQGGAQDVYKTVGGIAGNIADAANLVLQDGVTMKMGITIDPAYLEELKKEKAGLDLSAKQLGVLKDRAPDKAAKAGLQAQLDQINARKREIGLIQEQTDYQKKYGEEMSSTADYSSQIDSLSKIPYDFAKTTANQWLSDMGVSGNGALPALANWGMDMGSKFVFNVGNMDQAIGAQQTLQRKEAAVRY